MKSFELFVSIIVELSGRIRCRVKVQSIRSPDAIVRPNLLLSDAATFGYCRLFRALRVLELVAIYLRIKYTWQYTRGWKVVAVVVSKSFLVDWAVGGV